MLRLLAIFIVSTRVLAAEPETIPKPVKAGQLPKEISECSGIVRGRKHADRKIFWTLNDSGDAARIFAVDESGKLLRRVELPDATNVDWEDLSSDDNGRLIIADIGDNLKKRNTITLYRLPEPDALNDKEEIKAPEVLRFKYPDNGAFDAEALFVRGDVAYLFTKDAKETRVFALELTGDGKDVRIAKPLATRTDLGMLTGAALSHDGRHVAFLSYLAVVIYDLDTAFEKQDVPEKTPAALIEALFKSPRRTRIVFVGQAEAIAWDGSDLVLTTEGGRVFRIADADKPAHK